MCVLLKVTGLLHSSEETKRKHQTLVNMFALKDYSVADLHMSGQINKPRLADMGVTILCLTSVLNAKVDLTL